MGHAISYLVVDKKSEILGAAKEFAFLNVDRGENYSGSYHGNMRTIDSDICDNYDRAVEFIESHIRRDYDDIAVRFYDTSKIKDTSAIKNLKARCQELLKKKEEYIKATDLKNHKSNMIGCSKCGSRINKDYIHNSYCPACHTSMLSDTVKNRIAKFDTDYYALCDKIEAIKTKNKTKAPIKWCVKVEVHC